MRKSSTGLVLSLVLALSGWGCSDSGGGGTAKGGSGGSGSAGTTGQAGSGGSTGGSAGGGAGTTGQAGSTAGTGGSTAGTGGGAAGSGGLAGATAGAGGRGGSGGTAGSAGGAGATAGSGGATAGSGGATAGSGGSGGAGGTGTPAPLPALTGTATRPQLAASAATDYTILKYFEKGGSLLTGLTTDNWDPTAGVGDVATFTATYTVAASGGTHTTVQAALEAAVAAGGTTRVYIKVNPGTYRETICIKAGPPITLYGTTADASQTVIVNGANAGKMYVDATTQPAWNPCAASAAPAAGTNYGTSGSAAVAIYARDFQAKNLTFANDYVEVGTSNIQAVALMTQNDKQIYENVRVLGNQDSLYMKSGNAGQIARNYFKNCYIEGDTDFVFGRATVVLDGCENQISQRAARGRRRRRLAEHRLPQRVRLADHQQHAHRRGRHAGRVRVPRTRLGRGQLHRLPDRRCQPGLPERADRHSRLDAGRAHHRRSALGGGGHQQPRLQLRRRRGHPGQPPVGVHEHRRRRRAVIWSGPP